MPVKEILVLHKGGQPLFNFAPKGDPKLDTLMAGFISAQAGFAQEIGEEEIQVVSFAEHKFVYESWSDFLFIIVIQKTDDEHIYRVVLKELAQTFVDKYQQELAMPIIPSERFLGFREDVTRILAKYDLASTTSLLYPIALLPPETLQHFRRGMNLVEVHPGFHRTVVLTLDGYVVTSRLKSHELEFVLNLLNTYKEQKLPAYFTVSKTILGPDVKLFLHILNEQLILAVIVSKEVREASCAEHIAPTVQQLAGIDISHLVKVAPSKVVSEAYSDHEVLAANPIEGVLFSEDAQQAKEFRDRFGDAGLLVLRSIDGVATVADLRRRAGLDGRQLTDILNFLESKGYIRKMRFYPKLEADDKRFLTYLETVGLPRDEFEILKQAMGFCDGGNSVSDIAQRIGIDQEKLIQILRKLGDYVEWLT
ncbi:MAG: hypothetical protein ACFFCO_03980 [Promethearchaeota archaeon]